MTLTTGNTHSRHASQRPHTNWHGIFFCIQLSLYSSDYFWLRKGFSSFNIIFKWIPPCFYKQLYVHTLVSIYCTYVCMSNCTYCTKIFTVACTIWHAHICTVYRYKCMYIQLFVKAWRNYRIAGNFRKVKFSETYHSQTFRNKFSETERHL